MDSDPFSLPDQVLGIEIVRRAVEAPIKQIAENAGVDGAVVAQKVKEARKRTSATTP